MRELYKYRRMGVASHLGIRLTEYGARIRTFIPDYETMLDETAAAVGDAVSEAPLIVDLGIGSGALASRCLRRIRRARVVGIDSDLAIVALARRRLGARLDVRIGDFAVTPLPRCDAIVASFALHHVTTTRAKLGLYRRCFAALRPRGALVIADCCLASNLRTQARDRRSWRAHLRRAYSRNQANAFLRAWRREDTYFPLATENEMLRAAGFEVDVVWRRRSFAVIAARKP
jgi:trans-aconitate methyltransferase